MAIYHTGAHGRSHVQPPCDRVRRRAAFRDTRTEMKPLAALPDFILLQRSPELVRLLDDIRFGVFSDDDEYSEFCWFIREYPRIYRHHIDHAEYRLRSIRKAFECHHSEAAKKLASKAESESFIGSTRMTRSCQEYSTFVMYWDFEGFLQAIGAALDIAAHYRNCI